MASTSTPFLTAETRPPSPSTMPNLKYRNATPAEASHFSTVSVSTVSTPSSNAGGSLPQRDQLSRTLKSNAGSATSAKGNPDFTAAAQLSPTLPTKKRSGFLSFFGTKEPSTQAFLDYQAEIRKQQHASQRGPIKPAGMPMVSSAKLPANVPKVNSRWDGVPNAFARKEKEKRSGPQSGFMSHGSIPSRSTTDLSGCSTLTVSSTSDYSFGSASTLAAATSHGRFPEEPLTSGSTDSFNLSSSAPTTPLSDVSSFVPKIVREPSTLSAESGLRACTSHLPNDVAAPAINSTRTSTPHDFLQRTSLAFKPLYPSTVVKGHSFGIPKRRTTLRHPKRYI